jgi:hypothetical protein
MGFTVEVEMTSTGFAYFPGLAKPVTIDSTDLPAEEAAKLSELVAEADFFALPAEVRGPFSAADMQQYTITVCEDGERERCHTVKSDYPATDPALQQLLDTLREQVKTQRAAAKSATPEADADG